MLAFGEVGVLLGARTRVEDVASAVPALEGGARLGAELERGLGAADRALRATVDRRGRPGGVDRPGAYVGLAGVARLVRGADAEGVLAVSEAADLDRARAGRELEAVETALEGGARLGRFERELRPTRRRGRPVRPGRDGGRGRRYIIRYTEIVQVQPSTAP